MKSIGPQPKMRPVPPYSHSLDRGAVGDAIDGRSRQGRFLRKTEGELFRQIGEPSFSQRLLVRRVAKMMLLAEMLDEKLTSGDGWTPHDARTFGGLNNAIRLALRDLGLKPAEPKPAKAVATVAEIAARHKATKP